MFNYQVPLTIITEHQLVSFPVSSPVLNLHTSNKSWEKPGNEVISLVSQIYTRSRHGCNNSRPAHHLKLHLVSFPDKGGSQSRSYRLGIGNETDLYGRLHFTHARAGRVIAAHSVFVASLVPRILRGSWKQTYCVSVWKFTVWKGLQIICFHSQS